MKHIEITEKELREAIRSVKSDSRFSAERYSDERCGNAYSSLGDSLVFGIGYEFELYTSQRMTLEINDNEGWFLQLPIGPRSQRVYLTGKNSQNLGYAEIAELIETFMEIR